jgi:transposase
MVRMRAELVGPFGRHGRNFQTIEQRLRIVLCVYNVQEIEKLAACEMRSVIRFLNARNMKPADIHRKLCEMYEEHALSDSMVRRWVRHFNEWRQNVHDDPRSGRPSVVNEDFVRAVEEKIQKNRQFTISSLSLHFPQISLILFTKLCLINFVFENCVHSRC